MPLLLCTLLCLVACEQQKETFTDPRDKKTYKTVKIGEQIWMAENLNYEADDSKCYNDSIAYCRKYGRLYNWETAMKVCPSGWHLPSRAEWEALTAAVGGEEMFGKNLRATNAWDRNCTEEDKYGFSALPGGEGYLGDIGIVDHKDGGFLSVGYYGGWWSASEYSSRLALSRGINEKRCFYSNSDKEDLHSVRCVQDGSSSSVMGGGGGSSSSSDIAGTDNTFKDDRDNKFYKWVKIDKQVWMAENLNYEARYSVCYNDSAAYCDKYGRLYNWDATETACPSGWHLPNNEEWDVLIAAVGGSHIAGKFLKSTSVWNDYKGESGNGEDKYGFSALPGGYGSMGYFLDVGDLGSWWSVSKYDSDLALTRGMGSRFGAIVYGKEDNMDELRKLRSIRCLQDTLTSTKEMPNEPIEPKCPNAQQQKGLLTDTRDCKTYKTVKIGEQVWMAKNLNYAAKNSRCPRDSVAYCDKYGRFYRWETAMKACPSGWHLPSEAEWEALAEAVGGKETAGKYLKATSGWNNDKGESSNGTDVYGFAALPTYGRDYGVWWTTEERLRYFSYYWGVFYNSEGMGGGSEVKNSLLNVRCLQDTPAPPKGEAK